MENFCDSCANRRCSECSISDGLRFENQDKIKCEFYRYEEDIPPQEVGQPGD